jgi:hypothetical protein
LKPLTASSKNARRSDSIVQDVEFAVLARTDFALLDYRNQRLEKRSIQSDIAALDLAGYLFD